MNVKVLVVLISFCTVLNFFGCFSLPVVKVDKDVEQLEDLNKEEKIKNLELQLENLKKQLILLNKNVLTPTNENKPPNLNLEPSKANEQAPILREHANENINPSILSGDTLVVEGGVFGVFLDQPVTPKFRVVEKRNFDPIPNQKLVSNAAASNDNTKTDDYKEKIINIVENHLLRDLNEVHESGIKPEDILSDLKKKISESK